MIEVLNSAANGDYIGKYSNQNSSMSYFQSTLRFAKLVTEFIADEGKFTAFEFSDIINKRKSRNLTVDGYPEFLSYNLDDPINCMENLGRYLRNPYSQLESTSEYDQMVDRYARIQVPVLKNKQTNYCSDGSVCELKFTLSIYIDYENKRYLHKSNNLFLNVDELILLGYKKFIDFNVGIDLSKTSTRIKRFDFSNLFGSTSTQSSESATVSQATEATEPTVSLATESTEPAVIHSIEATFETSHNFFTKDDFGVYNNYYHRTGSLPDNMATDLIFYAATNQILEIMFSVFELKCDFGFLQVLNKDFNISTEYCSDIRPTELVHTTATQIHMRLVTYTKDTSQSNVHLDNAGFIFAYRNFGYSQAESDEVMVSTTCRAVSLS